MTDLVDHFMRVLGDQPLSLALVLMNFLLLYFLFKQGNSQLQQREHSMDLIVKWQEETQVLLASCVNKEIMSLIISALERDRELYRGMLPDLRAMSAPASSISSHGETVKQVGE